MPEPKLPKGNRVISSVQEAIDELGIPLRTFYRLRKLKPIKKVPGHCFITTRNTLWRWLNDLQETPDFPENGAKEQ